MAGQGGTALGLLDDAVAELSSAETLSEVSGAPGFAVEARCELAAALADRGYPGDAVRARALTRDSARRARILGMTPFVATAETLLTRLGAVAAAPLSPREHEVAQLVAGGLTNPEIARRLQLSERTVQNHVQHVLTKLDLHSRRRIGEWLQGRVSSPSE